MARGMPRGMPMGKEELALPVPVASGWAEADIHPGVDGFLTAVAAFLAQPGTLDTKDLTVVRSHEIRRMRRMRFLQRNFLDLGCVGTGP